MASSGGVGSPSSESIDIHSFNPTVICEKVIKSFADCSVNIGKLIRKGKYGAVYEGEFANEFSADKFVKDFKCEILHKKKRPEAGNTFALKYIDVPLRRQLGVEDVAEAVQKEINALMTIKNNGIVDFYFALKLTNIEQWFLLMELAQGNLQILLKHRRRAKQRLAFELTKSWTKDLAQTLKYLHENGINHGNIKSSNVLFFYRDRDKDLIDVKIADFVTSYMMTEQQMKNQDQEHKQLMENRMDEDIIDIYFLFTEILNLTEFKSENQKTTADQCLRCLITSDGNSTQLLDTLLKSKYLS